MKLIKFLSVLLIPLLGFSQNNFPFNVNYNLFSTSPGALRFGLNGFENPAILTYVKNPDFYFLWNNKNKNNIKLNDYGLFVAFKNIGFSNYVQNVPSQGKINNYKILFSLGNKSTSLGFAYQWATSNTQIPFINKLITLSSLYRPNKFISFGIVGSTNPEYKDYEGALDLAIRPFGNEKITLFGDYIYSNLFGSKSKMWSTGLVIEPFEGIQFSGRYFNSKSFTFGVQLSFGNFSILQATNFNRYGDFQHHIQGLRIGSYDRNIFSKIFTKEKTHQIDLNGQIKYQKFQLFDNSKSFYQLIDRLEKIKNDEKIDRVEINLSGFVSSSVFLWELRDKLLELKKANKKITIFLDNADLKLYHFASVADKIIMDPIGLIVLDGVLMGRNYYKGTLEKLGIGFDELRFFKYKSAAETYSREKMSDADREQRQLLVDNLYNTIKEEIENSRPNLKASVDSLINNYVIFDSKSALEIGLIDSVGRWYKLFDKSKVDEILRIVKDNTIESEELNEDNYWSEKPKIAIVYALGVCAMDEGIRARTLIKDLEKISSDNSIKAVVFRIDSPGGDALASDVIAEGIKKLKKIKPVIVSQGLVAGSGGYWLSMYGDTIVANKNTITGSIGVIGSWFYNKGFKESVGVSTDLVKRGEHADLGYGMIIPVLNIILPDRKLTNEERNKIEEMFREMYSEFTTKVSIGRNKSKDDIEKVAQGRVWSGMDAVKIGLVDVLGGLSDAIEIARIKANLNKNEYQIVEFPKSQLIDLGSLLPLSLRTTNGLSPVINFLKFNMERSGKPLIIMPGDFIPDEILINNFYR